LKSPSPYPYFIKDTILAAILFPFGKNAEETENVEIVTRAVGAQFEEV
jgi:hypothetical protein